MCLCMCVCTYMCVYVCPCAHMYIEGSRPDCYISSMLYSQDIPFWLGTLMMIYVHPTSTCVQGWREWTKWCQQWELWSCCPADETGQRTVIITLFAWDGSVSLQGLPLRSTCVLVCLAFSFSVFPSSSSLTFLFLPLSPRLSLSLLFSSLPLSLCLCLSVSLSPSLSFSLSRCPLALSLSLLAPPPLFLLALPPPPLSLSLLALSLSLQSLCYDTICLTCLSVSFLFVSNVHIFRIWNVILVIFCEHMFIWYCEVHRHGLIGRLGRSLKSLFLFIYLFCSFILLLFYFIF